MDREGLGGQDDPGAGREIGKGREPDVPDLGPEIPQHGDRGVDGGDLFLVGRLGVFRIEVAHEPDPHARHAAVEVGRVIGHRDRRARGVLRVVAGDGLEHERVVRDGAGDRADVVERIGQREDAAPTDEAVRRLHAGHAAHRRGIPDRSGRVRADRCGHHARGHRDAGPARRASRKAPRPPGIDGGRPGQVEGGTADGELVGRQLSEEHGPGRAQPRRDDGVLRRDVLPEEPRMRGGPKAGRVDDVLERERDAVERPAVRAGHDLALRLARRDERGIGRDAQERVQAPIDSPDPVEKRSRVLDRRQRLRPDQFGRASDADEGQVGHRAVLGLTRGRNVKATSSVQARSFGNRLARARLSPMLRTSWSRWRASMFASPAALAIRFASDASFIAP